MLRVAPHTFERWLIGHTAELHHAQIDISTLRHENSLYGERLRSRANLLVRDWISHLVPVA
jgi:GMP synthase (glutamine-hydrolysing)